MQQNISRINQLVQWQSALFRGPHTASPSISSHRCPMRHTFPQQQSLSHMQLKNNFMALLQSTTYLVMMVLQLGCSQKICKMFGLHPRCAPLLFMNDEFAQLRAAARKLGNSTNGVILFRVDQLTMEYAEALLFFAAGSSAPGS